MSTTDSISDTKDLAKDHAQQASEAAQARTGEVADHAKDATKDVAATATEQAGNVKDETVRQARNLAVEASAQVSQQAGEQTQRLIGLLRELGDELKQMASSGNGGAASELAHQGAERAHQVAGYLDGRDPAGLLDDARSFARRRPGAFIAGAAILGLAAGRLGRGIKDARGTDASPSSVASSTTSHPVDDAYAVDLRDENMGLSSDAGAARRNEALAVPAGEQIFAESPAVGVQP